MPRQSTSKRAQLPSYTTERGRELRRNATDAEKLLWLKLREVFPNEKFRRQQALGHYFADFCSHRQKLVIEVDGGQHAEQVEYDEQRTRFIEGEGYRVIRFWNNDVLGNIEGVLTVIADSLTPPHPSAAAPLPPSPTRGEGN